MRRNPSPPADNADPISPEYGQGEDFRRLTDLLFRAAERVTFHVMLSRRTLLLALLTLTLSSWVTLRALDRQIPVAQDLVSPTNYTEIEKGLFMGGLIPKPPPRVVAVLNLCEFEDEYECKHHKMMTIPDSLPAPNLKWLQDAVAFVESHHGQGRPTYIHCFAGISRSGMVTMAYLMKKNNWTRDEALAFVRKSRPIANPNDAFMERLLEWEQANRKR